MKKYENFIHAFYVNDYLKNRYPSPAYMSQRVFMDGDSCDIAAVALGYKPAAMWSAKDLKREVNDYFLTKCIYRGKELFYFDEENVVICDRDKIDEFKAIFDKPNSRKLGELLGYPEHLIRIFMAFCDKKHMPNWSLYDKHAELEAIQIWTNIAIEVV